MLKSVHHIPCANKSTTFFLIQYFGKMPFAKKKEEKFSFKSRHCVIVCVTYWYQKGNA